jgi:hypothetical protein
MPRRILDEKVAFSVPELSAIVKNPVVTEGSIRSALFNKQPEDGFDISRK